MQIFYSNWVHWIVFLLGITNLLLVMLIFSSCRIIPASKLTKGLMANKSYQKFYKYHSLFWKFFWVSVGLHAVLAILRSGLPWTG